MSEIIIGGGTVKLDELVQGDSPEAEKLRREISLYDQETRKQMSPAGALGLPPLLDQRRLEHAIIDGAFDVQCAFDAVFVYQPPTRQMAGSIHLADVSQMRERQSSPRAILIGAGLKALDELYTNGIELGHMVTVTKFAPFRVQIGEVAGKPEYCLMLRPGDITGSEDTRRLMREGKLKIVFDEHLGQHIYMHYEAGSKLWVRRPAALSPWMSEDQ